MSKQDLRGQVLLNAGVINQAQLDKALEIQKDSMQRIGHVLVDAGFISEEEMLLAMERQSGIPWIKLRLSDIQGSAIALMSQDIAQRYACCPVKEEGEILTVAISDPLSYEDIDDIRLVVKKEIELILVSESSVLRALNQFYEIDPKEVFATMTPKPHESEIVEVEEVLEDVSREDNIVPVELAPSSEVAPEIFSEEPVEEEISEVVVEPELVSIPESESETDTAQNLIDESEEPVATVPEVKETLVEEPLVWLDKMEEQDFWDLVLDEVDLASDIYLENDPENLKVRYRADGVIVKEQLISKKSPVYQKYWEVLLKWNAQSMQGPIQSLFANVGRLQRRVKLTFLSDRYGQDVHLKCLFYEEPVTSFDHLGLNEFCHQQLEAFLMRKKGVLLLLGDADSGLSTTLRVLGRSLSQQKRKVLSFERFIEYDVPDIYQFESESFELGYIYQDMSKIFDINPDVFIFANLPQPAWAHFLLEASFSGKLVVLGMNAKNLNSVFVKIEELGVHKNIFINEIDCVLRQSLFRLNCPGCGDIDEKSSEHDMKYLLGEGLFYKGTGCELCYATGYQGRRAIFDVLEVDEAVKELMKNDITEKDISKMRAEQGGVSLAQEAVRMIQERYTSIEEVQRIGLV